MLITVAVILCKLAMADVCVEQIVTDSTQDDTLTMMTCANGSPKLARWMQEHPVYREGWRIAKWKCTMGPYNTERRA